MRVLTFGATGVQGGPVARRLLEEGHDVRALVRHPAQAALLSDAGVELKVGDLGDRDSLDAASRGADAVFLHVPLVFDMETGLAYARNAVDAARGAGAELLVLNISGITLAEDSGCLHLDVKRGIEAYCRESGLPTIILRPSVYMEVLQEADVRSGIVDGTLAYPLPTGHRVSWLAVEDIAAIAVAAIERPELAGSAFEIGGPEPLNGDQLAAKFSVALERPISYQAIRGRDFSELLRSTLGDQVGGVIGDHFVYLESGSPDYLAIEDAEATAAEFGVELTRVEDWAASRDWTPAPAAPAA